MNADEPPFESSHEKHCKYADEIDSFICGNPEKYLKREKLYHIFWAYENWWMTAGGLRSDAFDIYVLFYIAERAFWSDINDSEFISKLLMYFHEAGRLSDFLFPATEESHFKSFEDIFSSPSPTVNNASNHFSHFFLRHAYAQHLHICGKRIVDMELSGVMLGAEYGRWTRRSVWLHPCEMAVMAESPTLLHILLQYGALIDDKTTTARWLPSRQRIEGTLNILIITLCVRKISEMLPENSCETDLENIRYTNIATCGRLIIRASQQLEKAKFEELNLQLHGFPKTRQEFDWLSKYVLPELSYRIYHPMPLKHACRLSIRRALNNNWQLPFGIDELLLPRACKEYLNLNLD